jgi:hypothetical protein
MLPFRVLEPGDPRLAGDVDVAFPGGLRQVVALEDDAAPLQVPNGRVHIVPDQPRGGGRAVRSGKLGAIDHQAASPAGEREHFRLTARNLREAEGLPVELLRASDVADGDRGDHVFVSEHEQLLSARFACKAAARFR